MPEHLWTLADLLTINDRNLADRNMSDVLNRAPLLARLPADIASYDTKHKYTVYDTPPVPHWRKPNSGKDLSKSGDRLVEIDLEFLDASFEIDVAIAAAHRFGTEAKLDREAQRHLQEAMFQYERQILNGTTADEDGPQGFKNEVDEEHEMFVSAGGSGNDAASVWLLDARGDLDGVAAIAGNEGAIDIDPPVMIKAEDAEDKAFSAWWTNIAAWLGVQVGALRSVARIGHITPTSPLDDDLIYEALSLFPSNRGPTLIAMNRRSLKQLRESRTATNATGAPAPIPTEVEGIEIVQVDSLPNDEVVPA